MISEYQIPPYWIRSYNPRFPGLVKNWHGGDSRKWIRRAQQAEGE